MLEKTKSGGEEEGLWRWGQGWGVRLWALREALPIQGRLRFPVRIPGEGWDPPGPRTTLPTRSRAGWRPLHHTQAPSCQLLAP